MRRLLAFLLLSVSAFATSTVSGTFIDPTGTLVASRTRGRFELKGCNGNIPRDLNSGIIVPGIVDVTPNASGAFSTSLYKNSEVDCGGQTSVTTWDFSVFYDGRKLYSYNFTITSATFNVNSATPNTVTPVVANPVGDGTYLRIDGGNQMTGDLLFSASGKNVGSSSIYFNAFLDYARFEKKAAPTCLSNYGLIWYDTTANAFRYCNNGGSATAFSSATGNAINVVDDCGLVKDNVTDNLAAMNTCLATNKSAHYFFPGCSFNPQGGGTANVPCYYFSGQIVVSYNGTWFDGPTPSLWNAPVGLRFASGSAGVRFTTSCYGCKISNLGLIGGDAWSSSNLATFPDWTPALLTSDGADGLQLLGGEPLVENVAIAFFSRHGIFIDGSSSIQASSQPDSWTIRNAILSSNRGYGIHTIGCDSNVGVGTKILTRGNMLAGIYDYSCLGNTWTAPDSALDGRSAISAGATSNITTVSVSATTMTLTTATAVSGWVASTWITVAGTVNCNGTFKVLSGTSSNMTLNYPSGSCVSEAVGTAQKASSASVFSTLTARSAGAGQAAIIECAYGSRSGSSLQVWVNPYQESNSAPPCWDTGTLVVGGQLASTTTTATGQGFTWLADSAGGLVVKGGQGATFNNPSDSLFTLKLQAGATARQAVSLKFLSFDASVKHTIQSDAASSALIFTDTSGTWMSKTEGGNLLIRGVSATQDIAINQSNGRDLLVYCGGASVCGKFANSDSNFSVNSIVPLAVGTKSIGTTAAPFLGVVTGGANGSTESCSWQSESLTLSTSGSTTDTSANLLPANSIVRGVTARITTTITTATDWALGDATTATRFSSANATMTAGTTTVGLNHWKGGVATDAAGPTQTAAAKVRVTTTGTPGAGVIRLSVLACAYTAPTS